MINTIKSRLIWAVTFTALAIAGTVTGNIAMALIIGTFAPPK